MFYHIYHRTVLFRSFPSRLFIPPSSPVLPSLIYAPPVPSKPVLSYLVLLFANPSSSSIETPSHPVPSFVFPCRLFPIYHVLTPLVSCHPVPSSSRLSLLVPPRSVLQHPVPSLPGLSRLILSCPKPSRLVSRRLVLFKSIYSHHVPSFPLIHVPSYSVTSCFGPPYQNLLHFLPFHLVLLHPFQSLPGPLQHVLP